jgi:hypothetical protein
MNYLTKKDVGFVALATSRKEMHRLSGTRFVCKPTRRLMMPEIIDQQDYQAMLKNLILEEVAAGIKHVQLAINILRRIFEDSRYEQYRDAYSQDTERHILVVDELIKSGDIIEIEYINPNSRRKISSFYLPRGTEILSREK